MLTVQSQPVSLSAWYGFLISLSSRVLGMNLLIQRLSDQGRHMVSLDWVCGCLPGLTWIQVQRRVTPCLHMMGPSLSWTACLWNL